MYPICFIDIRFQVPTWRHGGAPPAAPPHSKSAVLGASHFALHFFDSCSQAWLVSYPTKQGRLLLGTRLLVHRGFYQTYTSRGINTRILDFIRNEILAKGGRDPQSYSCYVTGAAGRTEQTDRQTIGQGRPGSPEE
jgi:hypothetical protein